MQGILRLIRKIEGMFDQRENDVPFGKRLLAYAIDWGAGGIFSGIPAVLLYGAITGKNDMFSSLYIFEALGYDWYWGVIAGLLCILFALFYYVYVPWKIYPGQTLGKRYAGVKIEKVDGSAVRLSDLLIRYAFAAFLLESSAYVISTYIRQTVTLMTRFYVDTAWMYAGALVTLMSVMMIANTRSHRGLHDYIAKTKVVLCS